MTANPPWTTTTIADATAKIMDYRGRTPKKLGMDWGDGYIPAISARNVRMGRIDFDEEFYVASDSLYRRWMTQGDMEQGDTLITTEAPLGNVAAVPDARRYVLSQRTVLLRPRPDLFDKTFFTQVLQSPAFQSLLTQNSSGSTALGIQRKKLEQLHIPTPPLKEQRCIASALRDADALIATLERLIAKKQAIKQGMMQQLLTGRVRFPGFAGEWQRSTLGSVCIFENGDRGINYPSGDSFVRFGIPFVNAGHLNSGQIMLSGMDYIANSAFDRLGNGKFGPGDILFCLRGSLGKFGVVGQDLTRGAIASSLVIVRPKPGYVITEYLASYFESELCSLQIEISASGGAQPNLGASDLAKFEIPLPPLGEQHAIAQALVDIGEQSSALQTRLEKARAVKTGMMQQLLTGRTHLPIEVA